MKEILALSAHEFTIRHLAPDLKSVPGLHELVNSPEWESKEVKNIRRTYVAEFSLDGLNFIFKIPRARDRRPWERLLTLFRAADVERFSHSMLELKAMGIPGPQPVMLGLRRRLGMVTHSFIIYRKLEGQAAANEQDIEKVCHTLTNLHQRGYLRRDALLRNFILTPDGQVGLIDFRLSQPRALAKARMGLECDKLLSSAPTAAQYLDMSYRTRPDYRLLRWLQQVDLAFKALKRTVRGR